MSILFALNIIHTFFTNSRQKTGYSTIIENDPAAGSSGIFKLVNTRTNKVNLIAVENADGPYTVALHTPNKVFGKVVSSSCTSWDVRLGHVSGNNGGTSECTTKMKIFNPFNLHKFIVARSSNTYRFFKTHKHIFSISDVSWTTIVNDPIGRAISYTGVKIKVKLFKEICNENKYIISLHNQDQCGKYWLGNGTAGTYSMAKQAKTNYDFGAELIFRYWEIRKDEYTRVIF